jgi:DMSO reductase anchor subunit
LRRIKGIAVVLGFAVPAVLTAGVAAGVLGDLACVVALLVQAPGLIADRWLFFAQAKHPQNLYYQVVS